MGVQGRGLPAAGSTGGAWWRSRAGGGDAVVDTRVRHVAKSFVEDGFSLPEAKSTRGLARRGHAVGRHRLRRGLADHLRLSPRIVKLWKRGTPHAPRRRRCSRAQPDDVASAGQTIFTPEGRYDLVVRTPAFFRSEQYLMLGGAPRAGWTCPRTRTSRGSSRSTSCSRCAPTGRSDGKTYPAGCAPGDRAWTTFLREVERVRRPLRAERARSSLGRRRRDARPRPHDHARQRSRSRLTSLALDDGALEARGDPPARARHRRASRRRPTPPISTSSPTRTSSRPRSLCSLENGGEAREGQVAAGVLRRDRHDDRAVRGDVEGRHEDPVLRRAPRRGSRPTATRRRCSTATAASRSPELPTYSGVARRGVARARRRLRARQHPRRRRVRARAGTRPR